MVGVLHGEKDAHSVLYLISVFTLLLLVKDAKRVVFDGFFLFYDYLAAVKTLPSFEI